MAIPIDLQTVYSQLSNVAKSASAQQQIQFAESLQQQNNIQKNLENSTKVQNTSNEKSTSAKINADGRNGNNNSSGKKSKNNEEDSTDENFVSTKIYKDPNVGSIIDITR